MEENKRNIANYDPFFNPEQTREQYEETENISIKGFPFPLDRNNPRGFFYRAENHDVIKADLIQLLLTEPGERVMMPSFGTPLRRSMFEFKDDTTRDQIRNLIAKSIERWEQRIVVRDISVSDGDNDSRIGKLSFDSSNSFLENNDRSSIIISIDYSLKEDLNNVNNLELRIDLNSRRFNQ